MEWIEKVANWGVPLLILVWIARWMRPKIDDVINSHLGLIETLRKEAPKATRAIEKQNEIAEDTVSALNENSKRMTDNTIAIEDGTNWWKKVGSDPLKICQANHVAEVLMQSNLDLSDTTIRKLADKMAASIIEAQAKEPKSHL